MAHFLVCCLGWGLMGLGFALINMSGENPGETVAMLSLGLLFSGGVIIWNVSEIGRMILKGILSIVVIMIGLAMWDNRDR